MNKKREETETVNIHKVNRMCSVKGCHNTDCYAISNSGEFGGVIICEKCLSDALAAVKTAKETGSAKASVGTVKPRKNTPLFFHPTAKAQEAAGTKSETGKTVSAVEHTDADKGVAAETDKTKGEKELKCPVCGKVCKNEFGLNAHMRSHDKK